MKFNSIVDPWRWLGGIARRFRRNEEGAVLVEMTLVTPFVLLLSAGVFEFSNLLHTRLLLEAGVEDAARYLARCSDTQVNCEARARQLAVTGTVSGSGSARVANWAADDVSISYALTAVTVDSSTGEVNYRSLTTNVVVATVSSDFSPSTTGLWGYLGFGAPTLSVAHEERVMGW